MSNLGVSEYIGARYVPKFYENSENPSSNHWEANVSYEPLTVVSYNFASWTSKIPVPNTVGNPASNPTYWALTGNYNGQVQLYREEVESLKSTIATMQSDIDTLKEKVGN